MSYEITGNRHMGAAMKKKQAYFNEWKLKARRKVMPGYPIEKPFETREQVEAYLNVDRLICLLCGKTYKSLCTHLSVHGTNADAYKEKYGLPWGCGLTCVTTKAMNIKHGKRLVAEGIFRPPTPEEHARMVANSPRPRQKPAFVIDECKLRVSGKQPDKLFTDEHYLKILDLAIENKCHPTSICRKNKGELPSLTMLHKYAREHAEYRNKYYQIIDNLPKRTKMAHGIRGVEVDRIKQLKSERKTNGEVAEILGIHEITVERYNKKFGIKKPPPTTCQSGLHPYPGLRQKCPECTDISSRRFHGTMDRDISRTIVIDRQCSDCQATIKSTRLSGSKRTMYCEECKKKRYYASQNKYRQEKRPLLRKQND